MIHDVWDHHFAREASSPLLQYLTLYSTVCGSVKTPETEEITDIGTGKDFEAEVVVFNCECHTYQQVVDLFCQVIPSMTPKRAFELAWQIDHQGSAIVFQGDIKNADAIGKKLAAGGLIVEVRY